MITSNHCQSFFSYTYFCVFFFLNKPIFFFFTLETNSKLGNLKYDYFENQKNLKLKTKTKTSLAKLITFFFFFYMFTQRKRDEGFELVTSVSLDVVYN
jgi:hypothetical protein